MIKTIALAGKGGTGKTSIAALLINLLAQKGLVLAVDADPSTNLSQALGLPLDENMTVGRIREKMSEDVSKRNFDPTMSKQEYLFNKIMESLIESNGFDLLAMGRPEGPGCYCAPNEFLRTAMDQLVQTYKYQYVVMDCEAGMEHISRRTTSDIDVLIITSDPTVKGITVATRIKELIGELRAKVNQVVLVVNRVKGELSPEIRKIIAEANLQVITSIPEDPDMGDLEMHGSPVTDLTQESPLRLKVEEIAEGLFKE